MMMGFQLPRWFNRRYTPKIQRLDVPKNSTPYLKPEVLFFRGWHHFWYLCWISGGIWRIIPFSSHGDRWNVPWGSGWTGLLPYMAICSFMTWICLGTVIFDRLYHTKTPWKTHQMWENTLPETNSKRTWKRKPGPQKGNEKVFQPSRTSGAKMLVSVIICFLLFPSILRKSKPLSLSDISLSSSCAELFGGTNSQMTMAKCICCNSNFGTISS